MTSESNLSGQIILWSPINWNFVPASRREHRSSGKKEEHLFDMARKGSLARQPTQTPISDLPSQNTGLSSSDSDSGSELTADSPSPGFAFTDDLAQYGIGDNRTTPLHDSAFRNRLPSSVPTTPDTSSSPPSQFNVIVRRPPPPPIHFTGNANVRIYDESASDDQESTFWREHATRPLIALSRLRLSVKSFPRVKVTARRDPPQTSSTKPSVAALLYILVAAGGPLSVSTAERVLAVYDKEYKNQTIRKAFCIGDTFVQTADKKAWTIPRADVFVPRQKGLGSRKAIAGRKRKQEDLTTDAEAEKRSKSKYKLFKMTFDAAPRPPLVESSTSSSPNEVETYENPRRNERMLTGVIEDGMASLSITSTDRQPRQASTVRRESSQIHECMSLAFILA